MSKIILFNKPFQVLSQFTDKEERTTLARDLGEFKGFYPAGRLDYDSEGLLLLTDDGQLQHRIASPRFKLPKTYWVQVEGSPNQKDLQLLKKGLSLKDGPARADRATLIPTPRLWERCPPVRSRESIPTQWVEICVSEGRNRMVRRMTAAWGFPTLRLVRASIGPWQLKQLQPGEYRMENVHLPRQR